MLVRRHGLSGLCECVRAPGRPHHVRQHQGAGSLPVNDYGFASKSCVENLVASFVLIFTAREPKKGLFLYIRCGQDTLKSVNFFSSIKETKLMLLVSRSTTKERREMNEINLQLSMMEC